MAKQFKVLRWLAPVIVVVIGYVAIMQLPEFQNFLFLMFGLMLPWEYFMFDRIYKNARDELKDRFGVRL